MTRTQKLFVSLATSFFILGGALAIIAPANAAFTPGSPTAALDDAVPDVLAGGDDDQIFDTIGNVVNVLLGLLGIIFFLLTLYAGFIWMTAQGDPAKVKKSTTMLVEGVIGMIIILSAYAISNFAITQLLTASQA